MRRFALVAAALAFCPTSVVAATIRCDVYAALNRFHYAVSLDDQSGALTIETDNGSMVRGVATMNRSGRTGEISYFLQNGFNQGFELSLESGGRGRWAFCPASNECYICTP